MALGTAEASAQSYARKDRPAPRQRTERTGVPAPMAMRGTGPANDECANAEPITVVDLNDCGQLASAGDNTEATESMGDPGCDGTNVGYADVWYSFNSGTYGTVVITLTPDTSMTDWVFVVYEGCDSALEISCNVLPEGPVPVTVTPGADYSVRVYSNLQYGDGGLFTLCVAADNTPPPANDACVDVTAGPLSIGAPLAVTGNNAGATITNDEAQEGTLGFPAVWEAFNLTDSCADVTVALCGTTPTFNNYFVVLSPDCPLDTATAIFANTESFGDCSDGNVTLTFRGLGAGTYYYPVLSALGQAYGPYAITFTAVVCAQAPANDDCAGAFVLVADTACVPVAGTTLLATQSQPADSCNNYLGVADDDVWYQFVATSTDMTISVQGGESFDAVVQLFEGTCGQFTEIGCADATVSAEEEVIAQSGLTVGTTYYLRLFTYSEASVGTGFTICVTADGGTAVAEFGGGVDWSVYPNPTDGDLNIAWNAAAARVTIEVLDATGRTVHAEQRPLVKGQRFALDMAHSLMPGTYAVRLGTGTERHSVRVVIR